MKREEIKQLLNKQETIEYVLDRLKEFYPLPTNLGNYIIAGGSVSSILNSLVNGVSCRINDMDVYTWKFFPNDSEIDTQAAISVPSPEGYTILDSSFGINRVEQPDPKLDIIDIKEVDSETGKNLQLFDIIITFDLNCTQSAISPSEKKIYYTEEFLDFLATRQIELHTISLGSILRAVRKADELGAYFDLYKASVLVYERQRQALDCYEVMECCSAKCYEKHKDYIPALEPHISVKTWDGGFYFPEVTIEDHPARFAFDIMSMYHHNVSSKLIINLYNKLYNNKGQHYRDLFRKFSERENLRRYLFYCVKDYIGINPEISKIDILDKFIGKHQALGNLLLWYDYNHQLQLMSIINKLEAKYGRSVIGIIESSGFAFFNDNGLDINKLIKAIEDKLKEQEKQLVKKALPQINSTSTRIKELICLNDLQREGEEMKHCVGGYGDNLKTNNSRIFSLVNKEDVRDRSTLQLTIQNNDGVMKFKVRQHHARQNNQPSTLQKRIVDEFVRILNSKELMYDEYSNEYEDVLEILF